MKIIEVLREISKRKYLYVTELDYVIIPEIYVELRVTHLDDFLKLAEPGNPDDKRRFTIYQRLHCFYIIDFELHVTWVYLAKGVEE